MSDLTKITEAHRRRRAVVYVRQSTLTQLERNHESRARQYALRDRALELGWPPSAISVVDDDLGRSGTSTDGRLGFKELVAEVGLGHVGLVLALEVSRFARSSADWHQLLDLCALTGTLIADSDGIYSPVDFNDRLLLGLKGTMSEAELHLIRARLDGGRRNKAKRGELEMNLPVGLDRDETGLIVLSADEQIRHAIERVFELWRRLGSARQVVRELIAEDQKLPRRPVGRRRVNWTRASYGAVHALLSNPVYAGAFVFGRRRRERRLDEQGRVRVHDALVPMEQWSVCIPEHHPGYVPWSEYLQTRERLHANMIIPSEGGGAAREGSALLQGLLRCGHCGRRMQVAYSGTSGRVPRYACVRAHHLHGTDHACQSLGGTRLERAITNAFLEAVTPAGIRASAHAIKEIEQQHDERLAGQKLALERAEFEVARARRQFDACEPENRLVARTLEARFESTLEELERQRRELAEVERARPEPLTPAERDALARIARDLPRLWDAPTTNARDRKELLRALITEVTVTVREPPRRAEIEILWEGGSRSELEIRLTQRGAKRTCTPEETVQLIRRLAEHHPDRQIAAILNKQGRRTGTGLLFTEPRVKYVRQQNEIPVAPPPDPNSGIFTIKQAAKELGVAEATIYRWLRAGLLPGEQTTAHAPWRIRLTPEIRAKFVPEIPKGYLPLDQAATRLGCARQTVLHKVRRGELHAVQVVKGQRKGLRIQVNGLAAGLFDQ
jgi:DNA invertase Pin-like site-specific DNA recombinase/predicted DNA-binding transcriptional regulator AlpA